VAARSPYLNKAVVVAAGEIVKMKSIGNQRLDTAGVGLRPDSEGDNDYDEG
jgi:hypothetical protein